MPQSRRMSVVESVTNLTVGNVVAWIMYAYVVPAVFGITIGGKNSIAMVLIFNGLSVVRSFVLRRLFERISKRL